MSDDNNYDWECTKNATLKERDPPLLYDLNTDPGERYPLNTNKYADVLTKMTHLRQKMSETIQWGPSEMKKGTSRNATPCCGSKTPDCTPYPTCCNCS